MRFCCFNLQLRNKLKSMFLLLRTARLKHLPFLLCILPLSFYLSICHLFSIFLYRQSLSIFVLYSLENTCEIRISAPFIVYFEFIFRSRSPFFLSLILDKNECILCLFCVCLPLFLLLA